MPRKYNKNKGLTKTMRKQVIKLTQAQSELKKKDETATDTSLTAASPFIMAITPDPVQGVGKDQRIGDTIKLGKISLKALVCAGTANGLVRAFVYQALDDVSPSNVSDVGPNEFFPDIQSSITRYAVLYDRTVMINPEQRSDYQFNIELNPKKYKVKNINFDSASTSINGGGALFLAITTNNTTTTQMTVDCNARERFFDM